MDISYSRRGVERCSALGQFLQLVVDDMRDELVEQSSYYTGVMEAWRIYTIYDHGQKGSRTIASLCNAWDSLTRNKQYVAEGAIDDGRES